MADESQNESTPEPTGASPAGHEPAEDDDGEHQEEPAGSPTDQDEGTAGDPGGDAKTPNVGSESGGDPASDDLWARRSAEMVGTVTMYTRWGPVIEVPFDFEHASRLLKCHETRRARADEFSAYSNPLHGWMSVDLNEIVAMLWTPGLPSAPRRTVVDPVVNVG